jgi:hypothetical protein
MSYFEPDYEDFYHEPSEFEMKMEELKQSLLNSVKEEYINEMERLRKENEELQEVKKNFNGIVQNFKNQKCQLEMEYQTLKNNVRKERLVELMEDNKVIMYKAYSRRELPPKCDKCDANRKIKYISPLGRETREDCLCNEGKTVYYPNEFIRYEFRLNSDKNSVTAWYRQYSEDRDGFVTDSSIHADYIYTSDIKFEDVKQYGTFFKSKVECQSYCDWLNSKNK